MEPARATGLTELYMARYIYFNLDTATPECFVPSVRNGALGARIIRDRAKIPRSGAPPFYGSPARFTVFFPRLFGENPCSRRSLGAKRTIPVLTLTPIGKNRGKKGPCANHWRGPR